MKFTKMQGLGNDYVYIDCFSEQVAKPEELAIRIADRRRRPHLNLPLGDCAGSHAHVQRGRLRGKNVR